MTEKQFQQAVIDYARLMRWRCYHTHNSRRSEPGFPDLVMVRDHEIIFAELKTDKGKLTAAQSDWLFELGNARRHNAYEWRPREMDRIIDRLKRIA